MDKNEQHAQLIAKAKGTLQNSKATVAAHRAYPTIHIEVLISQSHKHSYLHRNTQDTSKTESRHWDSWYIPRHCHQTLGWCESATSAPHSSALCLWAWTWTRQSGRPVCLWIPVTRDNSRIKWEPKPPKDWMDRLKDNCFFNAQSTIWVIVSGQNMMNWLQNIIHLITSQKSFRTERNPPVILTTACSLNPLPATGSHFFHTVFFFFLDRF